MRLAKHIFNLLQEKTDLGDGNELGDVLVEEVDNKTEHEENVEEEVLPKSNTATNTMNKNSDNNNPDNNNTTDDNRNNNNSANNTITNKNDHPPLNIVGGIATRNLPGG